MIDYSKFKSVYPITGGVASLDGAFFTDGKPFKIDFSQEFKQLFFLKQAGLAVPHDSEHPRLSKVPFKASVITGPHSEITPEMKKIARGSEYVDNNSVTFSEIGRLFFADRLPEKFEDLVVMRWSFEVYSPGNDSDPGITFDSEAFKDKCDCFMDYLCDASINVHSEKVKLQTLLSGRAKYKYLSHPAYWFDFSVGRFDFTVMGVDMIAPKFLSLVRGHLDGLLGVFPEECAVHCASYSEDYGRIGDARPCDNLDFHRMPEELLQMQNVII